MKFFSSARKELKAGNESLKLLKLMHAHTDCMNSFTTFLTHKETIETFCMRALQLALWIQEVKKMQIHETIFLLKLTFLLHHQHKRFLYRIKIVETFFVPRKKKIWKTHSSSSSIRLLCRSGCLKFGMRSGRRTPPAVCKLPAILCTKSFTARRAWIGIWKIYYQRVTVIWVSSERRFPYIEYTVE